MIACSWSGRALSFSVCHHFARSWRSSLTRSFVPSISFTRAHSSLSLSADHPSNLANKDQSIPADAEIRSSASQPLTSSANLINHKYSTVFHWTCLECGTKNRRRVYCPCGELNTAYQTYVQRYQSKYYESDSGKAAVQKGIAHSQQRRRTTKNTIREQLIAQSSDMNGQTCDWEGGCTVPKHLLNLLRPSTGPHRGKLPLSNLSANQLIVTVDRNTVDGKVLIRTVCPVHQATILQERRYKQDGDTKIQQQKRSKPLDPKRVHKLELKHCDHSHCFHSEIAECTGDTMHQFGLVPIVDASMSEELNLDDRTRTLSIHGSRVSKDVVIAQLEKCRLMHLTCIRDHQLQLLHMSMEDKTKKLREYLPTNIRMPDWYRNALTEAIDRHDKAVGGRSDAAKRSVDEPLDS